MEEKLVDIEAIIDLFKRKWWVIIVITALATLLGWTKASKMVPSYQGNIKILFSTSNSYIENYLPQELEMYSKFISSYTEATMINGFLEDSLNRIKSGETTAKQPTVQVEENKPAEIPAENQENADVANEQAEGAGEAETNQEEQAQQGENTGEQIAENEQQSQQVNSTEPNTEEADAKKENKATTEENAEVQEAQLKILAQKIRGVRISGSETYPTYTLSLTSITSEGMEEVLNEAVKVIEFNAKQTLPSELGVKVKVIQDFFVSTTMPNKKKVIMVGLIAGLVMAIGLVLVLDYLDDTVRSVEELEKMLPVPVLGDIPQNEKDFAQEGKRHVNSR